MAASVVIASAFQGREVRNGHHSSDRTHVKDLKNIFETQPPGGDRPFIFLRLEMPRYRILFNPLGELHLNTCYGPAIEGIIMGGSKYVSQLTPRIGLSHHRRAG